jgi:hypothetical protein
MSHRTVRCCTEQVLFTVQCASDACSDFCAHCSCFCRRLLLLLAVAPLGAPDSPVNYSGAVPEKPEGEEFRLYDPWCTGHCPVVHRTLSGGTPDSPVRQTRVLFGFFAPFF